jgi:K+/H+ antiporter YhaU regulatory subunit KhtT
MGTLNAWQKSGILVLGVKKPDGEYVINPDSAYIIDLNDRIIVLGNPDQTADIKKVL